MTVAGAYAQAPPAAPLPTVDDIIAKNLQAKGGAAKWQSMKSVKMTGKMTAQGTEMPLTVYAMRPNFNRQEITMPAGKAIQAFDGTTAWVVNPMLGIETPGRRPSSRRTAPTSTARSSITRRRAMTSSWWARSSSRARTSITSG